MLYWHCSPHHLSICLMRGQAVYHSAVVAFGQYSLLNMLLMMCLISLISFYVLRHHRQLPLVLSYHQDFWRCQYQDRIIQCDYDSGFVLGLVAIIKLRPQNGQTKRLTIALWYWDVITSESTQAGNWNQLRTILRYSRSIDKQDKAVWLSG